MPPSERKKAVGFIAVRRAEFKPGDLDRFLNFISAAFQAVKLILI